MTVSYLLAGIYVLLVLSAECGEAYILSQSYSGADQPQNEDFGMQDGEENDNSKVTSHFGEEDEGDEEKLNDVNETEQESVQYHDVDDGSEEEDGDDVDHHDGEEDEDGEKEDFGEDINEQHFANYGFAVDVAVHVGGHHGADEHYVGGDDEFYAEKDDDNDDDDDKKDQRMDREDENDHYERNPIGIWTGPEPFETKE
nr:unnamed protein product [Spirometra erinaceieuropaei]